MDGLANAIAGLTPATVTGTWQRHVAAKYVTSALDGRASYSRWGRERGFPILYLGQPLASVTVEAYRRLVDPVEDADDPDVREQLIGSIPPRSLVTARVEVSQILDLRTATARHAVGLSPSQVSSATSDRAAYAACQEVAAAAHQQGFHGLIAPAATELGETLALFTDVLPCAEWPVVVDESLWDRLPADPRQTGQHRRLRVVRDT